MSSGVAQQPTASTPHPHPGGGGGTKMRHLLMVFLTTVVVAGGIAAFIAYRAGAFRPKPRFVILTSTEDVYWDRLIDGAKVAAAQLDVDLDVVRSRDENMQSQTVRDALARGVHGVGISPVNAAGQAPLLREVGQKAPVVTFDSDAPDSNRLAFVGTDNYVAGRQVAELVRDALPDGGEVIISVGSVANVNGSGRRQGLIDSLRGDPPDPNRPAHPLDQPVQAGKWTVVATLLDGGDPAKATALASEALTKHPNVKCFVALWSYSAPSVLAALRPANKVGQIKVVGFDESEETLAGIEAGHIVGTLVQDQYNMGYDTVRVLYERVSGVAPDGATARTMHYLPCRPVTSAEEVDIVRYEKARERLKQGADAAPSTAPAGGAGTSGSPSATPSATPATQPAS